MAVNGLFKDYLLYWLGVACVVTVIISPLQFLSSHVQVSHWTTSSFQFRANLENVPGLYCCQCVEQASCVHSEAETRLCSTRRKKMVDCTKEKTTSPCFLPPASIAVSGSTFPVQSNLAGGVSKEHNVVKQKSDLLHSLLGLAPSLSPLEITLNDICYHQDNLCQLRDKTADVGPQIVRGRRKETRNKGDIAILRVLTPTLQLVKSSRI